jgi:hypothetical protein
MPQGVSATSQLALMRAVADHDASARATLVERLHPRVLTVSRRYCSSLADAEDAPRVRAAPLRGAAAGNTSKHSSSARNGSDTTIGNPMMAGRSSHVCSSCPSPGRHALSARYARDHRRAILAPRGGRIAKACRAM